MEIRNREDKSKNRRKRWLLIAVAGVLLLGVIAAGFAAVSFGVFAPLEIENVGGRQLIRVPKGGDLQAALKKAQGGDVIELAPGAVYSGIVLPVTDATEFITIQTAGADKLPADKRVTPQQSNLMAKIVARSGGKPAVEGGSGTHHYRFVGIEFAPASTEYNYNLIYLAASTDKRADVPHDFEFDRCYVHAFAGGGVTRRGLALNSANTVIKNSFFEGFGFPQEEAQAICGWTGTKNVKILNNYLEGGAETILFGGSDPANADLIPQDIEVRGNHLSKAASWKGKASIKNILELKNAKRVQVAGNYLDNGWSGSAFTITVRNQDGKAPFSAIEDVTIRDNYVVNAGEGVNILGTDDTYPSQILKRLTITNNVFLELGGSTTSGNGYFVQVSGGEDILISNNTAFNTGNLATFHGTMPKNFVFRDNIAGHGNYGVHGLPNIKSPDAQRMFQNNLIVNNRRIDRYDSSFPAGNLWIDDYAGVGFLNFAQKDLRLAANSRFKAKGANKSDIGCDIAKLPDPVTVK